MANAITFSTREPHRAFRLSMLLNDSRYRSYTIQIFVLMCLMLGIAWLVDNTVRNLASLGKDFSFSFLWSTAGYDINQRLIEYDTEMTHGRAALVGLLNTVVLAVLSCALATIIGVAAGVLRLSGNPIVARLMTVYVEVFRNIPLLLWILVFGAIMSEAVPAPNAFKGENATAGMILGAHGEPQAAHHGQQGAGHQRRHAAVHAVEAVRFLQEVRGRLRRAADPRQLGDAVRRNREVPERLDDGRGDRIVPAPGAQRRDRPLVVALGQADRVLLQSWMENPGLWDIGHAAFSNRAFTPEITWCALIGKPP